MSKLEHVILESISHIGKHTSLSYEAMLSKFIYYITFLQSFLCAVYLKLGNFKNR